MQTDTVIPILIKVFSCKISNIDVVEQTFDAELDCELKWKASKDEYDKYKYNLMFPTFKPKISFPNTTNLNIKYTTKKNSYFNDSIDYRCTQQINGQYWIIHNFIIHATFYKQYKLFTFPFDSHNLSIIININTTPSTWNDEKPEKYKFIIHPNPIIDPNSICSNTEWMLHNEATFKLRSTYKPINSSTASILLYGFIRNTDIECPHVLVLLICNNFLEDISQIVKEPKDSFTSINITFKINRNYQHYVYRFMLLLMMITFFSMIITSFLHDIGQKLLCYLILILSIIAIQFYVASKLQNLPYFTFFDQYSIGCIIFIILLITNSLICNEMDAIPFPSIYTLGITFILYHILFILYGLKCINDQSLQSL